MFAVLVSSAFSCYSTCPPWYKMCTMQCADRPWYEQKKYKTKIETDPDFRLLAEKYLAKDYKIAQENSCYSACPPWFKMCTKQCMPVPWNLQQKWINLMKTDPEFREKAKKYLRGPIESIAQENSCYSACPPWFKMCTKQCMPVPWNLQQKWVQKMRTDPEFREIAMRYLK